MPRHRLLPAALGAALAALAVLPAGAAAEFAPERIESTSVGGAPAHVLVGDVTGDGRLDQVVTSDGADGWVRRGEAAGGIGAPGGFDAVNEPIRPLLADVNRDGLLDLVSALASGSTSLLGAAVSPLASGHSVGIGGFVPTSVSAPRIDANPYRDRAVTAPDGRLVWVTTADGTTFGSSPLVVSLPVSVPNASVSGDFDGDGNDDVAVAGSGAAIAWGNGGSFGSVSSLSVGGLGPVADLVAADLDRDGRLDLVGSNPSSGHLLIWRGNGDGLGAPFLYEVTGGFGGGALAVGRLDGDDRPDLALADFAGDGRIVVLRTGGEGVPVGATSVGLDGGLPYDVAIGDLDGDGAGDISAVDTFHGNVITIFSGPRLELPSTFELGQQAVMTQSGTQTLIVRNRGWAPVLGGVTPGGLPEGSPFDIRFRRPPRLVAQAEAAGEIPVPAAGALGGLGEVVDAERVGFRFHQPVVHGEPLNG